MAVAPCLNQGLLFLASEALLMPVLSIATRIPLGGPSKPSKANRHMGLSFRDLITDYCWGIKRSQRGSEALNCDSYFSLMSGSVLACIYGNQKHLQ